MSFESHSDELANRLDEVTPASDGETPVNDENPAVNAALRLTHAPRVELSEDKKAAILTQAMAKAQPEAIAMPRLLRWSAPQRVLAAAVGLVVMALLILYVFAPAVNRIVAATRGNNPPDALALTPITTVTEQVDDLLETPQVVEDIEGINETNPLDDDVESPGRSGSPGDFGCEHPGNFCNAPGQTKDKNKNK